MGGEMGNKLIILFHYSYLIITKQSLRLYSMSITKLSLHLHVFFPVAT